MILGYALLEFRYYTNPVSKRSEELCFTFTGVKLCLFSFVILNGDGVGNIESRRAPSKGKTVATYIYY